MKHPAKLTIHINRWKVKGFLDKVASTNTNPSMNVQAVVGDKKGLKASVHIEATGDDEHQVHAFVLWTRDFANSP